MTREEMLKMSEKNLAKAKKSLDVAYNRKGITEVERTNLLNKVEYEQQVYDLIAKYM